MDLQEVLLRLLKAELDIGSSVILWREIIGNGFGLASAFSACGARSPRGRSASWATSCCSRSSSAPPSAAFDTPQKLDLCGQAGRQVFFIIVSVYGWVRWYQYRKSHAEEGVGVRPRWAGAKRSPAAAGGRRGSDHDLLLRAEGAGLLGSAGRCLDPDRLDPGHLRHGPRLGGVLAGLDRGRPVGVPLLLRRLLPVGDHVHLLRRVLRRWLRGLASDRARERAESPTEGVATPEVETVG